MNRSISKIRHLQEVNRRLEKKYLIEQDEQKSSDFTIRSITQIKKLCDQVIDLMDDISDELEDCKESENAKSRIEENIELRRDIEDLMEKLELLIAREFNNENPFGI